MAEKSTPDSMSLLEAIRNTPSTGSAPNIEEELSTHLSDTSVKKSTNCQGTKSCDKTSRASATFSTGSLFDTGSYCKESYFQTSLLQFTI